MRAYLISGSYTMKGFQKNVMNELKKDLSEENSLCFIPTDFDDIEKNIDRCKKIVSWFNKSNIEFKHVYIIDNIIKTKEAKELIKKSNVIFLNGGDTLKQIKGINSKKIKEVLNDNSKVIIGMSAGAINMAKTVLIAKDVEDNIPETMQYDGIGVTDINIEPHCDFKNREHWKDLLDASEINKIYCMKGNCSIIIRDNKTKFLGNYCIINNGEIEYNNIKNFKVGLIDE